MGWRYSGKKYYTGVLINRRGRTKGDREDQARKGKKGTKLAPENMSAGLLGVLIRWYLAL